MQPASPWKVRLRVKAHPLSLRFEHLTDPDDFIICGSRFLGGLVARQFVAHERVRFSAAKSHSLADEYSEQFDFKEHDIARPRSFSSLSNPNLYFDQVAETGYI